MIAITKKFRKVVVCGHEVKIRYKKKMRDFGEFRSDENEIHICDDEKWKDHLVHELFHAMFFYSGHSEKFKDNEEESLVRMLENGLKSLVFVF